MAFICHSKSNRLKVKSKNEIVLNATHSKSCIINFDAHYEFVSMSL